MKRSYKGISINTSKYTHEKVFSLINTDTNSVIIDIPTGGGAFVKRLLDHGYNKVIAIDIENILEFDHADFLTGDMTKRLTLNDNTCEVAVCIDGIEHIYNQVEFVKEIFRVLKSKGVFIISTPNTSSLRSRWKFLMTGHHHKCDSPLDENNPTPLHHVRMLSFPEIRYLLHTNGFRIEIVTTNRIKIFSWIYALILPFVFLSSLYVYNRTGKKQNTRRINAEVFRTMFSKAVLFGETIIIKAIKC